MCRKQLDSAAIGSTYAIAFDWQLHIEEMFCGPRSNGKSAFLQLSHVFATLLLIIAAVVLLASFDAPASIDVKKYVAIPAHKQPEQQPSNDSAPCFVGPVPESPYSDFPWWGAFEEAVKQSGVLNYSSTHVTRSQVEPFLQHCLARFIAEEPATPLKVTSRPTPLTFNCSDPRYANVLTGDKREDPVRVVWGFLFSSESMILEISLYDTQDAVDYWFVAESTVTNRGFRKPLYLDYILQATSRLDAFKDRIVHLVLDDWDAPDDMNRSNSGQQGTVWAWDKNQHRKFHEKITAETMRDRLSPDDIFVYGDGDEIPSAELLLHLKHCVTRPQALPMPSNIVFYQEGLRFPFESDYPPDGRHPYSLKFPTIHHWHTLSSATPSDEFIRAHGPAENTPPPGGYHLTSVPFLPHILFKYLNSAESGSADAFQGQTTMAGLYELFRHGDFMEEPWRGRIAPPGKLPPAYENITLPWVVTENLQRYQPLMFLNETVSWWEK